MVIENINLCNTIMKYDYFHQNSITDLVPSCEIGTSTKFPDIYMMVCTCINVYFAGYCAFYNTVNNEIIENYEEGFECSNFPEAEQCPSRYPSTESYKCNIFK